MRCDVRGLVLPLLLSLSAEAFAQSKPEDGAAPTAPAAGAPAAPQPKAAPPVLVYAPEPAFPEEARAAGLTEGGVVLRVMIDRQGQVTAAEVVESAGHGFDELAREAALQHRFEPAQRDGQPVAARILLRVGFHLPPQPPAAGSPDAVADAPPPAAEAADAAGRAGTPPLAAGIDGAAASAATPPRAAEAADAAGRAGTPLPAVGADGAAAQGVATPLPSAAADAAGRAGTPPPAAGADGAAGGAGMPPTVAEASAGRAQVVPPSAAGSGTAAAAVDGAAPSAAAEVTVRGKSQAERLRRSADAVHVVETTEAKRRTSDLGEVLARTQGVGVQRAGGLGSDTRFSLNGLTDDQIRFFLDEIPLEFAGYPFGIANVPINLVERVEIFRGVVPIRFGADALGGAVNVVSDQNLRGTHASASLQAGSFGTYMASLSAQHLDAKSGWFNRVSGFFDRAKNDYPMTVDVPDARGRVSSARVYRFHDGYAAEGANLETGVIDKPWAKRLLLRGFVTHYDKEIQHNLLMTFNPYGDITLSELTGGATLRYENAFAEKFFVDAVAGYTLGSIAYKDVGDCVYDWFGQCVRKRPQPGERNGRPEDQLYTEQNGYARVNVDYRLHPEHLLKLSVAPTYTGRTGDERRQVNKNARDPLSAERDLTSIVSGLEYKADLADHRFENVLFVKDYLQILRSEDPLSNGGAFQRRDRNTHRFGIGDSLRYTFSDWIYAKASYEWATRLPRPDEIFGNAFPIQANLDLRPELSHNLNLGVTVDAPLPAAGKLRADVNGFLRNADQLIVLIGNDKTAMYQNVYSARSLGAELAAGWTSPGDYIAIDGNFTYVDFRNTSKSGAFAANEGERIPNRPYMFGNATARLQLRQVAEPGDELALIWASRYVHSFYRGWEGLGTDKLSVPSQLLHSLALTYLVRGELTTLSLTCEVQNLTDQAAYDFFGVPRPGRAVYFKATASL